MTRGPVCVKVRRWGFPHGPAHPLFTPSRLHFDITYTYFAGQPWFLKEGTMTVVRDLEGSPRDDEWVFSGQPFTDTLWMDADGALHEGAVTAGHEDDLWGVGFFHRRTRDAFIALFLEHSACGCDDIVHGGAPQLDYQGIPRHAQLWSRSPARGTLRAGTVFCQRNAYLVGPYEGAEPVEMARARLLQPLQSSAAQLPVAWPEPSGSLTLHTREPKATAPLKDAVWSALREVRDEMFYAVDANIVDMGYVYDLRIKGDVVHLLLTMPHRGRPQVGFLVAPLRERLLGIDGVGDVVVEQTWEPPWTVARLTKRGREVMGLEA